MRRVVAALASVWVAATARAGPAPESPVVEASRAAAAIVVDGRLDEPAWASAGVIPDLLQQAPRPGASHPYRTEVRVLVNDSHLYFGITCTDPEPARIAVHTMQRDASMDGDDTVALVLDPFLDRRNAYYLRVNAAGARVDGLVSGPEELSFDWDGVWEAKTRRTPGGWTLEIDIPAQTLRFPAGAARWGLNVERFVPRDRTTLRWSGATLDAKFPDLSRAGELAGLGSLKQGLGLSISPYALGRYKTDFEASHSFSKGQFGLDLDYNLTPGIGAALTANPDFAETDVDQRQINLTRFPLFFPEKRSFFLEGSNLFEFGLGLGSDFIPFYSRRVGLYAGRIVPLDAGLKILGRSGPVGLAVLDVAAGPSGATTATNLFAGRVTVDFDSHLRVGAIVTNGNPDGIRRNTLAGLDAVWRTSTFQGDKNLFVGLWGAKSFGDVGEGRRTGGGFKLDYPNDLWDLAFNFREFGDSLGPALGFLPRPGTRDYWPSVAYQPRPGPGAFSWVRQFFFEASWHLITDLSNRTQTATLFLAPFNVRTQSGEHLELNLTPTLERLDAPFEISRGVFIPPGLYSFTRWEAEAESSDHRPVRLTGQVVLGRFFTGTLTEIRGSLNWSRADGRVQIGVSGESDYGDLPEGRFIDRLWQVRGVLSATPDLVLSTDLQFDSTSRNLGANVRLRWTIRPGREVYVVWNRGWREPGEETRRLLLVAEQVVAKLRWTFRP